MTTGPGRVTFDFGGKKGSFGGGQCDVRGEFFYFEAGALPNADGPEGEHLGLMMPVTPGAFTDEHKYGGSINYGGTGTAFYMSGTRTDSSGSFTATDSDGRKISGSWTC